LKSLDVLTDAVADLGVTLLLATSRRISEAMRTVRVSQWNKNNLLFFFLYDLK
jgi:lactate dehydrogenase-like 2-hydroxyacid dehydrogenase